MFARANPRFSRSRQAAQALHEHPLEVAREELRCLSGSLRDLVSRMDTSADPEIMRVRRNAEAALSRASAFLSDGAAGLGDQARQLAEQGQEYVRQRPLMAVGVVALFMLAIGLVTGRTLAAD